MGRNVWRPGNMLYPVPAVMVSCKRPEEKANIITVAWTGTVCSDPAMVYISVRPERYSHGIIQETGEFVINLVSDRMVRSADWCGVKSGRDVDKFSETGLTELPSEKVSAPTIGESPVAMECVVDRVLHLGTHDMFIAKVVAVTVDDTYMDGKGKFHLENAGLTCYSHGEYYSMGDKQGKFGFSVEKANVKRRKK